MNERIEKLAEQAMAKAVSKNFTGDKLELQMPSEAWAKEFTELIIGECVEIGKQVQSQIVSNGSEEYIAGREMGIEVFMNQIKQHFGVEEPKGWVCSKCGVDRTKVSCPQGHTAAVEGKCPMIGVAR